MSSGFFRLVYLGSVLITFGAWWTRSLFRNYNTSCAGKSAAPAFHLSATLGCRWIHLEAWVKVVASLLGVIGTFREAPPSSDLTFFAHISVFCMFAVAGLAEILIAYGLTPWANLSYVLMLAAVILEGLTFGDGRFDRPLEQQMNLLLQAAIWVNAAAWFAELVCRNNFICAFTRVGTTMLQGSWMVHAAFVLHGRLKFVARWKRKDAEMRALSWAYFCWHIMAVLFTMLLIGSLARASPRRSFAQSTANVAKRDDAFLRYFQNVQDACVSR